MTRTALDVSVAALLAAALCAFAACGDRVSERCGEGVCGVDGRGGYCTPCALELPGAHPEQRWTLCDEALRECVSPEPDCRDGWCRIPAASFIMGGFPLRVRGLYEWAPHPVVLTRSFHVMATEVTQGQWLAVMEGSQNPSPFAACGLDCPVSQIWVYDMLRFANRLSERQGLAPCYELEGCEVPVAGYGAVCQGARFLGPDCEGYRLPSEAEWVLAAGTGTTTCSVDGPLLPPFRGTCLELEPVAKTAWFCGNSGGDYEGCFDCSVTSPEAPICCGPHPVATKPPNRFGLHDMLGNVGEVSGTRWTLPTDAPLRVDPGFDADLGEAITSFPARFIGHAYTNCLQMRTGHSLGQITGAPGLNGFRLVRTARGTARPAAVPNRPPGP